MIALSDNKLAGTLPLHLVLFTNLTVLCQPGSGSPSATLPVFGNAHNAVVSLLGLLSRHEMIARDVVVTTAAIGAYVSMVGKLTTIPIELWESYQIAKYFPDKEHPILRNGVAHNVNSVLPLASEAAFDGDGCVSILMVYDNLGSATLQASDLACSEVRRRAALKTLIKIICG
jgi:hypothetical protein